MYSFVLLFFCFTNGRWVLWQYDFYSLSCALNSIIPEVIQGLTKRFLRLERVLRSTLKLFFIIYMIVIVNFSNSSESMLKLKSNWVI